MSGGLGPPEPCLDHAEGCEKPPPPRYCLPLVTAQVHCDERRLPEALDTIQDTWKLVESVPTQVLKQSSPTLIYFSTNRDTEAWKYAEIALMNASHVGNRLVLAQALESMGYGYLRRGDYETAYGAYGAAAEKYPGTLNAIAETRCKDNMAKIKRKQENPDAEVGFQRHGVDPDESLFYPPVQASPGDDMPILDS
jgi:tetratricopeptide (TPR) repeat protein